MHYGTKPLATGTASAFVDAMSGAAVALASPGAKSLLSSAGGEVVPGTPEQFGSLSQSERLRCQKLI
jgi:hypothetical protein